MAVQLAEPKEIKTVKAVPAKDVVSDSQKESYTIYSIYYANKPEEGYVVYSSEQHGWEFFGYMPADNRPRISRHKISRRKHILL